MKSFFHDLSKLASLRGKVTSFRGFTRYHLIGLEGIFALSVGDSPPPARPDTEVNVRFRGVADERVVSSN